MLKACLEEERNLLFQLFRIRSYQLTGSQQTTVRFHRSFVQIIEGFPILLIQSQTTQLLCKLLQPCKVRDLQDFARRSSYVEAFINVIRYLATTLLLQARNKESQEIKTFVSQRYLAN